MCLTPVNKRYSIYCYYNIHLLSPGRQLLMEIYCEARVYYPAACGGVVHCEYFFSLHAECIRLIVVSSCIKDVLHQVVSQSGMKKE